MRFRHTREERASPLRAESATVLSTVESPMIRPSKLFLIVGLLAMLGCASGRTSKSSTCDPGDENCTCYPNATCDGMLVCIDGFCGQPGATNGGSGTDGQTGAAGSGCTPDCENRDCGLDPICNTSCGTCNAGFECVASTCRAPQALKLNGDTCSTHTECASQYCGENGVGESHCYGDVGANMPCEDSFDCRAGACLPKTLDDGVNVCVPGAAVCVARGADPECRLYAVYFCQLIQECGAQNSDQVPERYKTDFDYCVGSECQSQKDGVGDLTPMQCTTLTDAIQRRNFPCP